MTESEVLTEKTPISPARSLTLQDCYDNRVCSVKFTSTEQILPIEIPRTGNGVALRERVAEQVMAQRRVEDPEIVNLAAVQICLLAGGKELDYSRPPPPQVEAMVLEDSQTGNKAQVGEEAPPKRQSRSLQRLLKRKLTFKSNRLSTGQSQVFGGEEPSAYTLPPTTQHRGYKLWKLLIVLFGSSSILLSVILSFLWYTNNRTALLHANDWSIKLISRAEKVTKGMCSEVLIQLQTQTADMIKVTDTPELKLACLAVELTCHTAEIATGSNISVSTDAKLQRMWSELHSKFHVLHGVYSADATGWFAGYQRLSGQSQPHSYHGVYRPAGELVNLTGDCLSRCPPQHLLQQEQTHTFTTDRYSGEFLEMGSVEAYDPRVTDWYQQAVNAQGRLVWVNAEGMSSGKVACISAVQATIVEGEVVMVSRADVSLDHLTQYLVNMEKDRQSLGGISFVVDRSDHLIASSSALADIRRMSPATGKYEKLEWNQTGNMLIVEAGKRVLERVGGRSFADVSTSGVHIAYDSEHVFSYKVVDEFPWIIVNSQPRQVYLRENSNEAERIKKEFLAMHDEVLDRTSTQTMQTIAVSSVIILLGGVVVAIISKSVERPLRKMRRDMKSVTKLDFEKLEEDVRKSESLLRKGGCWNRLFVNQRLVREVSEMRDSFMFMANGLRSFSKYMDPYVVRALMEKGRVAELKVAPEEVTIFFSDMAGFTSIAESLPPTALMDLLKEYLEEMSNIILEKSGVVGEFIGDAVMAWWNAPIHVGPYHTVLALTAALEQQQRLVELRKRWAQHNKPRVEVRMGLARGDVLAGNIGSERRMKYGLVGDSVNLASRLEGLCKYYGVSILIDERAYQADGVEEKFFCRPVDVVAVKGRNSSTEIYELVGNKEHMGAEDQKRCLKFCDDFKEIHDLYRKQEFERALALTSEFLQLWPMDVPAQMMKSRCEKDMASEVDENWSPVQKMSHK